MGSLIPPAFEKPYLELEKKCGRALKMDQMFPDDMSIGEEDKTVQLVLIYGSIAVLYLAVAYIMFFRKKPNEKEDPAAKEGEKKKEEEPKPKDKKLKKKD